MTDDREDVAFVVSAVLAGRRLDQALTEAVPGVSRSQLTRHVTLGFVRVNGDVCPTPSRKLRAGDAVRWSPPPVHETDLVAEDIPLVVLHEDEWLVVIDKPPGLVVHPAPGHPNGTLVNALLAHCRDLKGIGGELRPGIVHRLDKDTSGVMVVAKDEATLAALGAAFKAHTITRTYEALVVGALPAAAGRIETLHGRDPHDRKKFSTRVKTGRKAITAWRSLESWKGAARIEATLETGRTHQVRVHCAGLGCPILGDAVYGRPPRDERVRALGVALGRQALHARLLGFRHPATGADVRFETQPPADFARALAGLRRELAHG